MADIQTGSFTALGSLAGPYGAAVGAALDLVYGSMQAKKAVKGQEKYLKAVRDSAVTENVYRDRQLNLRQAQTEIAASEEKLQTQVNNLRIADRMQMSAAEHGVGGASINAMLRHSLTQGGRAMDNIDRNVKATQGQLAMDKQSGQSGVQSLINGVPRERVGVDMSGVVSGLAGTGVDQYGKFKEAQKAGTLTKKDMGFGSYLARGGSANSKWAIK